MPTKTGTVALVARNKKAFTLEGDETDRWYTAFNPSQCDGVGRGATVEFTFKENQKGERTYYNIQRSVKVINPGMGGDDTNADTSGVGSAKANNPPQTFGNVAISTNLSIARQNACNVAAAVLARQFACDPSKLDKETAEWLGRRVVDMAQVIEDYTTGEMDKREAKEKMEAKQELANMKGTEVLDEFDDVDME